MRFRLALLATTTVLALVAAVPAEAARAGTDAGSRRCRRPLLPAAGQRRLRRERPTGWT